MNRVFTRILTLGALLAFQAVPLFAAPAPASAGSEPQGLFWRVETVPPVYLLGTIHLPDVRVTTLAPAVEKAFREAGEVVLEIPLDAESVARAGALTLLPEGQSLRKLLPEAVAARSEKVLARYGFSLAMLDRLPVWALSVQLPLFDHLQELMANGALDAVLYRRASQEGKRVGALETVEEQIHALSSFSLDEQLQLLLSTLDELENTPPGRRASDPLLEAYLSGDLAQIERAATSSLDPASPIGRRLTEALITRRNSLMAERLLERMRAEDVRQPIFVAVGALHLPGPSGLVQALRAEGYEIVSVDPAGQVTKPMVAHEEPALAGTDR